MLVLNYTSLESSNSNPCCQALHTNRPVVKAKHRSFIPSVLNFLLGDVELGYASEISNHAVATGLFMEDHSMEICDSENSRPFNTSRRIPYGFSHGRCTCGKSHRSEDIFIRQNEDGNLSHFCPLNEEQDGEKDENEDYPDQPMQLDYIEIIKSGYALQSEDIPYLMAEKPFASESDENIGSDVDASTSMIYPLTQNLVSTKEEDISMQLLSQVQNNVPSLKTLDEKTMTAWAEDSSDELEDYDPRHDDSELLQKHIIGDHSDMEDFNENCEDRNEDEDEDESKPEKTNDEGENEGILKNMEAKDEPLNDKGENNSSTESSNKLPTIESSDSDNADKSRKGTPDSKSTKEDESHERGKTKDNECDFHSTEDQEQIDALKAEVEKAILYSAITPNDDGNFKNPMRDLLEKVTEFDSNLVMPDPTRTVFDSGKLNEATAIFQSNKFESESDVNAMKYLSTKETEDKMDDPSDKAEGMHQTVMLVDSSINQQTEVPTKLIKEEGKSNLSMEPVAMNLSKSSKTEEPKTDLATALRFMSEVYHTNDDDDMFSDTLSVPDMQAEAVAREKTARIIADSLQAIKEQKSANRSIEITAPRKSSTFEPVLTEEQREAATRPRNKFTKFLKSFKKKLVKKA